LQALRNRSYELVILIESDVLVSDGWFEALRNSMEAGEKAGFKVGAASCRVLSERVLSVNDGYCLLLNSGAGFIALTPPAVDIVLANYRTTNGGELIRLFRAATGLDIAVSHGVGRHLLTADYLFDALLYAHGYVVTAPPVTMVDNIDPANAGIFQLTQVTSPAGHAPERHHLLTSPDQIHTGGFPFFRFQISPFSMQALIPCQHLLVSVGSTDRLMPVRADGCWRHRWNQGIGPFTLFGTGRISVAMHDSTISLILYTAKARAEIRLYGPNGHCTGGAIEPHTVAELHVDAAIFHHHDAVLEVADGELGFIGVTVSPDVITHYANREPSFAHLPL